MTSFTLYGYITNSQYDQLPDGLIAQKLKLGINLNIGSVVICWTTIAISLCIENSLSGIG